MKTRTFDSVPGSALSAPGATAAPLATCPRLRVIPRALAAVSLVLLACTDTTVQPVEIDEVRVIPERVDAVVSTQSVLTTEVRDLDGNLLPDRTVDWASLDTSVVTVDPSGVLTAVAVGQALVTATAGSALGSALVVVQERPVVRLTPTTLAVNAVQGASGAVNRVVRVTNQGGGTLNGLSVQVAYDGGPTGWLTGQVSQSHAPADLMVAARPQGLGPGTYGARVIVSSPHASRTLAVSFRVDPSAPDPPARVEVNPDDLEFRVIQSLSKLPDAQSVQITNDGPGTLSGLVARVSYQGASGWLWINLTTDRTPATLHLRPTRSNLALGRHYATVTVTSSSGGSETVEVTYRVREP